MKKTICAILMGLSLTACANNDLQGKAYRMVNAENNADITLSFDDECRYHGKVVNSYFGSYEINDNEIKFGDTASTMMMGPLPLMDAEQHYFKNLQEVKTYTLDADTLTLHMDDNRALIFSQTVLPEE